MYNQALAGNEKETGHEHTSTLDTVNNLGNLYYRQGRFDDAERMFNRALAGTKKASGHEHTFTLDTVNNIGSLYTDQGRFEDAERMYDWALVEKEKALGHEHTSTLYNVDNLGILYARQGHFNDAERMYERALAGKERAQFYLFRIISDNAYGIQCRQYLSKVFHSPSTRGVKTLLNKGATENYLPQNSMIQIGIQ